MSSLLIVFLISLVLTGTLVGLKVAELDRGRRIFLPHVRELIDHSFEVIPAYLWREIRLVLARLSLKGHGFTTWFHDEVEVVRGFFRRRTIKLYASVHTDNAEQAERTSLGNKTAQE